MTTTTPDAGRLLYDPAKLVAWRTEAGMTREHVHRVLPISYSYLADLEYGRVSRAMPSTRMLARLAEFYGHPLAELMTPPDPPC